jgi:hypothetical protein
MVSAFSTPSYEDVHFLKTVYRSSRPVGVYRDKHGYRAKVLKRIPLGSYRTERAAAVAVVTWYREHYGEEWRAVLASRHCRAVQYVQRPYGGYTVTAYVYGSPVRIRGRYGRQTASYFPTLRIAEAAVKSWLVREFGMFAALAPVFLYRISDKFRPRPG